MLFKLLPERVVAQMAGFLNYCVPFVVTCPGLNVDEIALLCSDMIPKGIKRSYDDGISTEEK